jgi:hypothetical protein
MKKLQTSMFLATMTLGAIALSFAATGRPGSGITAGELSGDLSRVARLAGATEISRRLMEADPGMKATTVLTEASAVAILQKAGLTATTSSPERLLTRRQADVLVGQFRSSLAASAHNAGAGVQKSGSLPDSVDDCFDEYNHGLCVQCCKALGGGASSCAKACMVINKPSASEPLP